MTRALLGVDISRVETGHISVRQEPYLGVDISRVETDSEGSYNTSASRFGSFGAPRSSVQSPILPT
jgi:hypothetical protein